MNMTKKKFKKKHGATVSQRQGNRQEYTSSKRTHFYSKRTHSRVTVSQRQGNRQEYTSSKRTHFYSKRTHSRVTVSQRQGNRQECTRQQNKQRYPISLCALYKEAV